MIQLKKKTNIINIYDTIIDSSKSVCLTKFSLKQEENNYYFY